MNIRILQMSLGAVICAVVVAVGGSVPASAAESVQKVCGEEWKAAKSGGKVPAGQAWPGFLSECRKRHAADAASPAKPVPIPVAAPAKPVAPPAKPVAPPPPVVAVAPTKPAPAAAENPADACKAEYTAGKTSGSVPKGTNYFKYLSDCRKRRTAGGTPAAPASPASTAAPASTARTATQTPPPAAATAPQAAPAAAPVAAPAQAGTKPVSAGREAFVARERQCGTRWKAIKGTSALPAGVTTWPKYLSYCNARIKQNQPI